MKSLNDAEFLQADAPTEPVLGAINRGMLAFYDEASPEPGRPEVEEAKSRHDKANQEAIAAYEEYFQRKTKEKDLFG